jgi:hypothetical protein
MAASRTDAVLLEDLAVIECVSRALVRSRRMGDQIFEHRTEPVGDYL